MKARGTTIKGEDAAKYASPEMEDKFDQKVDTRFNHPDHSVHQKAHAALERQIKHETAK